MPVFRPPENREVLALKTAVNNRMPLRDRTLPIQTMSGTASRPGTIIPPISNPSRPPTGEGQGATTSGRVGSGGDTIGRGGTLASLGATGGASSASPMGGTVKAPVPLLASGPEVTPGGFTTTSYFLPKRHVGHTTYTESAQLSYVRGRGDVPPRAHEPKATEVAAAAFSGTATSRDATLTYAHEDNGKFYSHIRRVEAVDDLDRHALEQPKTRSGASRDLRFAAITRKRETDKDFAPPPQTFSLGPKARPNPPFQSQADLVKFTHLTPSTTGAIDFKDPDPIAEKSSTIHSAKTRTKLRCDRAIVVTSTGADLMQGTGKSREELVTGFMGHVPGNPKNVGRVKGPGNDLLKEWQMRR